MLKIPCAESLTRQQIALPVFDARKIETIHPRRRLKTFCRVCGQNALEQPLHSINSPNSRSRVSGRDTQAREPRPYAKSNILPLKRIPPFCCWRRQALGAGPSARQASRRSFFPLPFQSADRAGCPSNTLRTTISAMRSHLLPDHTSHQSYSRRMTAKRARLSLKPPSRLRKRQTSACEAISLSVSCANA